MRKPTYEDLRAALAGLLAETNQHASGNGPKLLAACERARAVLAASGVRGGKDGGSGSAPPLCQRG